MKKIILVIYILSLRFGFQTPLVINYPDNVAKSKRKYKNYELTDEGQRMMNWR